MALTLTMDNYDSEALHSEKPVLLYFWAPWCPYCTRFSPIVDAVTNELPHIKVATVDIDEQPDIESRFEVMSVPTLILLIGGEIVYRTSEVKPKAELVQTLNELTSRI